jgi:hypothetical protein
MVSGRVRAFISRVMVSVRVRVRVRVRVFIGRHSFSSAENKMLHSHVVLMKYFQFI